MSADANVNAFARHWTLDRGVRYLNHGSFGACPRSVLAEQQRLREEMEREPVDFFVRRLPERIAAAREGLAAFLGADPQGLAAVANATSGASTVLRSLTFAPGDELLVTDHAYPAARNAAAFVAERSGARLAVAPVPFPLASPANVEQAVLAAVGPQTKLLLIDHVTSPTGLIFPVERLVRALAERGIDTLVDGAHAPGMLPLALDELGAAYYVGNCHKWLCAPKGAGFLHVRADRRDRVRPLAISHGFSRRRPGTSPLNDDFDWTGTNDPSPFLCVPVAIDFVGSLVPGGWPAIRSQNHELVLAARRLLVEALGVPSPAPDDMLGSLATVPLPHSDDVPPGHFDLDPLQDLLRHEHAIETPVFAWPAPPRRLLRVSAQLYNEEEQYRDLAKVLAATFGGGAERADAGGGPR